MTHTTQLFYYNQAIISKSNGPQHSPGDFLLSPDMLSLVVEQKQYVTPTVEIARIVVKIAQTDPSILAYLGENSNTTYATWRSNDMAMQRAGVAILAGTDAMPLIPINGSAFGWTLHEELANLIDAGFTTAEALRSATLFSALLHNFPTCGRIAFGMRTDLVLLAPGANPLEEITATKNISRVWIGGLEYSDVATQPFLSVAAL
jgi:imidazolonepropionase-like amidohydrolase